MKTIIKFLRNRLIGSIQFLLFLLLAILMSWQYLRVSWLDARLQSVERDGLQQVQAVDTSTKILPQRESKVERPQILTGMGKYIAPAKGGTIIEPYGWALYRGTNEWHFRDETTISLSGDKNVRAVDDGMVQAVLSEGTRWRVKVDHGSGVNTVYRNLRASSVSQGDAVKQGEILGATEELVFSIVKNGMSIDPSSLDPAVLSVK